MKTSTERTGTGHGLVWSLARGTVGVALGCAAMLLAAGSAFAQDRVLGFDPYVTFSGNFDVGYRKTQFFEENHNTALATWDSRVELWLPPFRDKFSWGPYLRVAGVWASEEQPWENAWLASPGVGGQIYPFSLPQLRDTGVARVLGPLRLFGEYNRQHYWGSANSWRPDEQTRIGAEYWRALHVNDDHPWWWAEIWSGLWWQSANEFDPHYNSWVFANALRAGIRKPRSGLWSAVTPYVALESSLTDNQPYYWENRLLLGGGIRFAPSFENLPQGMKWLNRAVIYAEALHTAAYYRQSAPSSVPDYDVRVGLNFSIGQWYR